jgi:antitoxin (DNA-binding transcriptional repressor) of toxin-antitoxin stability system
MDQAASGRMILVTRHGRPRVAVGPAQPRPAV